MLNKYKINNLKSCSEHLIQYTKFRSVHFPQELYFQYKEKSNDTSDC